MKILLKIPVLILLTFILLSGCATNTLTDSSSGTPALKPVLPQKQPSNTSSIAKPQRTTSTTIVLNGKGLEEAQRTPIVIKVSEAVQSIPTAPKPSESTPATPPTVTTEAPSADTPANAPTSIDDTLNILVVGSDERNPGQAWRSDVIMIVAVDFEHKQIGIISFPRDLYLNIPTVGKNRINTATFFGTLNKYPGGGGIGLLEETLRQNFGIRTDHYIKLNFKAFIQIVDALGGVDIVIDRPLTGEFPIAPGTWRHSWQTLQPGKYHMDGRMALAYVRERKTTSDIDRNRRQQQMILALRKRAIDINVIPRLPALYAALKDNAETDLGLSDVIALSRLGLQVNLKDVHRFNIGYQQATNWKTPDGASVLIPDMPKIQAGIQALFTK